MTLGLTDVVERLIDKAQVMSSFLVGYREDRGPLWGTSTGSSEEIHADRDSRDVEVCQNAVEHSGVVRNVRGSPLLTTVDGSLL